MKTFLVFPPNKIGLIIGDLTWDFCRSVSSNVDISTAGSTLEEQGDGIYVLDNPNITESAIYRIHESADENNYNVGVFAVEFTDYVTTVSPLLMSPKMFQREYMEVDVTILLGDYVIGFYEALAVDGDFVKGDLVATMTNAGGLVFESPLPAGLGDASGIMLDLISGSIQVGSYDFFILKGSAGPWNYVWSNYIPVSSLPCLIGKDTYCSYVRGDDGWTAWGVTSTRDEITATTLIDNSNNLIQNTEQLLTQPIKKTFLAAVSWYPTGFDVQFDGVIAPGENIGVWMLNYTEAGFTDKMLLGSLDDTNTWTPDIGFVGAEWGTAIGIRMSAVLSSPGKLTITAPTDSTNTNSITVNAFIPVLEDDPTITFIVMPDETVITEYQNYGKVYQTQMPLDATETGNSTWGSLTASITTNGSIGKLLKDNVDTTISSAYEEARRARATSTNKVTISRVGTTDTITVYDDDGITVLYTIEVVGEDSSQRNLVYSKPY